MIADIAAGARIQAEKPRVLSLDIERLPGRARHEHRGLTIEGDFWDLSGWKSVIGYRLPIESVLEWPRTICVAWKWYGSERLHFAAEWQKGGSQRMHERVWEAYDRAHVLYGHNVARFDTKHLNTGWRDLGLPEPSPYKTVDTLKEARKKFGDESHKLAALTQRLGISTKTDTYNVEVARAACAGDREAQRQLKDYNCGDVVASEALVDRLRGWIKHPHPLAGTADDRLSCENCWGYNLTPTGTRLADQITYQLYRCQDCGKNNSGTRHSRAAITRGVA